MTSQRCISSKPEPKQVSNSELVVNEVGLWYSNIYDCKSQADSVKNAFGEVYLLSPLIHYSQTGQRKNEAVNLSAHRIALCPMPWLKL